MLLKVSPILLFNQSQKQRNLVLFHQFRRVLVARNNNNNNNSHLRASVVQPIFVVNKNQVRSYQSDKKWNNAGFIDTLAGIYEDPNYKLDLKPEEIRDGQILYYLSEFGVSMFVLPCVLAIFLGIAFLAWYTLFDPQTTVLRNNPDPFLLIRNGKDLQMTRNPILAWTWPLAPHEGDQKIRFYYEIKDAIERKERIKSAKMK
jgi:hypothetical protein